MSGKQNIYRGTESLSLEDISISGTIHPGNFRLPRFSPSRTFTDADSSYHPHSFKLFAPRRAASDLTSRGSSELISQYNESTLTQEFKLRRHVYVGDTIKSLSTLPSAHLIRLQKQNVESKTTLAEKLHGFQKKKSSNADNFPKNSPEEVKRCFESVRNQYLIVFAVFFFLAILATALGLGIYFGVVNKTQGKYDTVNYTTYVQKSSTLTTEISSANYTNGNDTTRPTLTFNYSTHEENSSISNRLSSTTSVAMETYFPSKLFTEITSLKTTIS